MNMVDLIEQDFVEGQTLKQDGKKNFKLVLASKCLGSHRLTNINSCQSD
jgi:hypothetical protein